MMPDKKELKEELSDDDLGFVVGGMVRDEAGKEKWDQNPTLASNDDH